MIWLGWRLQRTETLITAAVLALIAALLIPSGIEMASAYRHDGLSACLAQNNSLNCGNAINAFTSRFESLGNVTAWLTLLPGLLGVTLAAPLILDLENGTYRLAWTQSITRRRWIAGKVGLAAGVAILGALALTLLLTWWRTPFVHLQGRVEPSSYDSEGIVVFGYTLFALGLAMAIGVVWRRAVPALVVAFLGYFGVRIFVDTWLRQRLVHPLSATWKMGNQGPDLQHAWVLTQSGGKLALPRPGPVERGPGGGVMHAVYHPASHFWPLQSIETAIFGGTALVLLAFAAWWVHERTA